MRDVTVGTILLAVAGVYWIQAAGIPVTGFGGPVSAQVLPKNLAIALAVCSVLLILQGFMSQRRRRHAQSGDVPAMDAHFWRRHLRAAGMLAIGVAYSLVVEVVGYAAGIFLVLVAGCLYMGGRLSARLLCVAGGGAAGFWLIFVKVLNVPMPSGILKHAVGSLMQ